MATRVVGGLKSPYSSTGADSPRCLGAPVGREGWGLPPAHSFLHSEVHKPVGIIQDVLPTHLLRKEQTKSIEKESRFLRRSPRYPDWWLHKNRDFGCAVILGIWDSMENRTHYLLNVDMSLDTA
jgi:hypothetical protein